LNIAIARDEERFQAAGSLFTSRECLLQADGFGFVEAALGTAASSRPSSEQ
jgi:hypothetical protein